MKTFDTSGIDKGMLFSSERELTDEQFRKRNLLLYISSVVFMITGSLFLYFGFYLLTWTNTVRWGALSIALGLLILLFGFSLWQDRQVQTLQRTYQKNMDELRSMMQELLDIRQ